MEKDQKIMVEMTEEEYEKYLGFAKGRYVSIEEIIEEIREAHIYDLLRVANYELVMRYMNYTLSNEFAVCVSKYKKGRTNITVEITERG